MVDPEKSVPEFFKGIKEPSKLLNTFFTHIWWVLQWSHWIILTGAMYYRPSLTSQGKMDLKNSFEFHTWMIAKLIKSSGTNKVPLCHYVIAVSYEKMITRMTYRVSKSFRDALKNVPPMFKFPKRFTLISASNSNDKNFICIPTQN